MSLSVTIVTVILLFAAIAVDFHALIIFIVALGVSSPNLIIVVVVQYWVFIHLI